MTLVLFFVVGGFIGIGILLLVRLWRLTRRRQDLGSVKPSWLSAHGYSREGDDRQAK
jgi:hypothetical protein